MGLYLAVFEGEDELDGVEVGAYADFAVFRDTITATLEGGDAGCRFPILINHSDCDGEWSAQVAPQLKEEFEIIESEFAAMAPIALEGWKQELSCSLGLRIESLVDCFFDVDGEPLLDRLIGLAEISQVRGQPILFQ